MANFSTRSFWVSLAWAGFFVSFLSGCRLMSMEIPEPLQTRGVALTVIRPSLFSENLRFGTFQVLNVDRDWTERSGVRFFGTGSVQATQRYRFQTRSSENPAWEAQCLTNAQKDSIQIRGLRISDAEHTLECGLYPDPKDPGWQIRVVSATGQIARGWLKSAQWRIEIDGNHKVAGTGFAYPASLGYLLRLEGRAIAAIEMIGERVVWLHKDLEPSLREPVATAVSALLLYMSLFRH